ncbi:hypothetical protein BDN71DRAFT_652080 [Pleurotus eryngii]|uniref:Uncharacterized protein n=1 Tax=Pleurotus eryngii TaxID=5323 RepID=A0A9P6D877_PLEER|nr:hypothetical protein BDN71DRAFT_652080 [Pleurotus eryngii]
MAFRNRVTKSSVQNTGPDYKVAHQSIWTLQGYTVKMGRCRQLTKEPGDNMWDQGLVIFTVTVPPSDFSIWWRAVSSPWWSIPPIPTTLPPSLYSLSLGKGDIKRCRFNPVVRRRSVFMSKWLGTEADACSAVGAGKEVSVCAVCSGRSGDREA